MINFLKVKEIYFSKYKIDKQLLIVLSIEINKIDKYKLKTLRRKENQRKNHFDR